MRGDDQQDRTVSGKSPEKHIETDPCTRKDMESGSIKESEMPNADEKLQQINLTLISILEKQNKTDKKVKALGKMLEDQGDLSNIINNNYAKVLTAMEGNTEKICNKVENLNFPVNGNEDSDQNSRRPETYDNIKTLCTALRQGV